MQPVNDGDIVPGFVEDEAAARSKLDELKGPGRPRPSLAFASLSDLFDMVKKQVDEYAVNVGRMREAQSTYFKSRTKADLLVAKSFERTVDAQTQKILDLVRGRR
jgi:hypothetical protein